MHRARRALCLAPVVAVGALAGWAAVLPPVAAAVAVSGIWAWGVNGAAGMPWAQGTPTQILGLASAHSLAYGTEGFVVATDGKGQVWSAGSNARGGLGDGKDSRPAFEAVPGLTAVKQVIAGNRLAGALKSDGSVWAWGYVDAARFHHAATPTQVPGLTGITAVAGPGDQTVSFNEAGFSGEVGSNLAVRSDGTVWSFRRENVSAWKIAQVVGLTQITAVSVADDHSIALRSDGTVWTWGGNSRGQLGTGTTATVTGVRAVPGLTDVAAVAAGRFFNLALRTDGSVWAWGANDAGQLADGTVVDRPTPQKIPGLTNVKSISSGRTSALALDNTGHAWTWGDTTYPKSSQNRAVQVTEITKGVIIGTGNAGLVSGAAVPKAQPTSSATTTGPTPAPIVPRTVGDSRVGSTWAVADVAPRSYLWLRCGRLDAASCEPIPGAHSATYRIQAADFEKFVAVDITDAAGRVGRSRPRYVIEDVCKIPIELEDGHYYKTRKRASTSISPRPGWGCLRVNMYIAAKRVDVLGLGNNRGPSPYADASQSKASMWINFETGRVDVVANHTDTKFVTFNAFPVNVGINPDADVARDLVKCVRVDRRGNRTLDEPCQKSVYDKYRKPNSAGFSFPEAGTSGNQFRIRYHFTNAARRVVDTAPAAIDGIFGISGGNDGRLSVSCAFIDQFPSIEIYQDHPSPRAGESYDMQSIFYRKETTPRALNADAPKYTEGSCGRIPRPATDQAALDGLTGVVANIHNKYHAPIGADPYEDVMRDFKSWSPM